MVMVQQVEEQTDTELWYEFNSRSFAVNDSIQRRIANDKDNITQTLRAGRELHALKNLDKEIHGHGHWLSFLEDSTDYKTPRDAQNDMQFYTSWSPWINSLVEEGFIRDINTPETEFVSLLSDTDIDTCKSAMMTLARNNTPELAFELAIDAIRNNGLSIQKANELISFANEVEALAVEKYKETAINWYKKYEFLNPDIVKILPDLYGFDDILEEINNTGMLFVPGAANGEGRQISIARAGITDIELALGYTAIETELARQTEKFEKHMGITSLETKTQPDNILHIGAVYSSDTAQSANSKESEKNIEAISNHITTASKMQNKEQEFDDTWLKTYVGTPEKLLQELTKRFENMPSDTTLRIVLYEREHAK